MDKLAALQASGERILRDFAALPGAALPGAPLQRAPEGARSSAGFRQ